MTRRQYLAWRAWRLVDLDTPSRTDYYLMQIAQKIVQGWAKDPKDVTLDDQRLPPFKWVADAPKHSASERIEDLDRETSLTSSHKWLSAIGGADLVNVVSKAEADEIEQLPMAEQVKVRRQRAKAAMAAQAALNSKEPTSDGNRA